MKPRAAVSFREPLLLDTGEHVLRSGYWALGVTVGVPEVKSCNQL
jgi:hypothetical protein